MASPAPIAAKQIENVHFMIHLGSEGGKVPLKVRNLARVMVQTSRGGEVGVLATFETRLYTQLGYQWLGLVGHLAIREGWWVIA